MLYVFMQKIRNSFREKMVLSIIFESYGTYERKIYWNVQFPKPRGHIDKKFIEMSHFRKVAGHINKKLSAMSCFWKVMGHRRQERAHMSQREQREGHRRQEKLHMSSQCHRNVLPIFFNDKNYRLFGEYLTNTLWGYTISVKIMQ